MNVACHCLPAPISALCSIDNDDPSFPGARGAVTHRRPRDAADTDEVRYCRRQAFERRREWLALQFSSHWDSGSHQLSFGNLSFYAQVTFTWPCVTFRLQSDRRNQSKLQDAKDRLEQAESTNRSMKNYISFLKSSYNNVFGADTTFTSTPLRHRSNSPTLWQDRPVEEHPIS